MEALEEAPAGRAEPEVQEPLARLAGPVVPAGQGERVAPALLGPQEEQGARVGLAARVPLALPPP